MVSQGVSANGAGTLTLSAGGGGSDLATSAALSSTSGIIALTAGNNLSLGANVTTAAPVSVTATNGTVTNTATVNTSSGNAGITITAGTGTGLAVGNLNAGIGTLNISTDNSAVDIGSLDAGALTGSVLNVTAGNMTTGSGLNFAGLLNLNSGGAVTLTNAVASTGSLTVTATGALTGAGGMGTAGDLTLNVQSVGSVGTPLTLTAIGGELGGTLSGTGATDVFNVKASGPITITLGTITATGGFIGHPVTIDSSSGSILHGSLGTDITGGRVNFWGTTIGQYQFDLQVVTDNPPVFCNGTPCGLPYFVNGTSAFFGLTNTLPDNVLYLLAGGKAQLLTSGILPDNIYNCLSLDREGVVCTAGAMWHDDDGSDGTVLQPAASGPAQEFAKAVPKASVLGLSPVASR
jgi:hypothetical protein